MKLHGEDAIRLVDRIEAEAMLDMYAAAPADLQMRTEIIAGATLLLAPRFPVSYFNRVIGLGGDSPASETDLDEIISAYRRAGVSTYWIHLSPATGSPQLRACLLERGFVQPTRRSWAKFLREPEPPPPCTTDLRIRPALREDAAAVAQAACLAYGLPPTLAPWFEALVGRSGWQLYVGTADKNRVVATGALYLRKGTGWLGIGATLPEYRQRGAQSALLAERIIQAGAAACSALATETGEAASDEPNPSLANIRRSGFVQVCSRLNFTAPG